MGLSLMGLCWTLRKFLKLFLHLIASLLVFLACLFQSGTEAIFINISVCCCFHRYFWFQLHWCICPCFPIFGHCHCLSCFLEIYVGCHPALRPWLMLIESALIYILEVNKVPLVLQICSCGCKQHWSQDQNISVQICFHFNGMMNKWERECFYR